MQSQEKNERFFSIELNSKQQIKNMSMTEGKKESTLIEGTIGNLLGAIFTEGIVLEVTGTKGTLRLDLQATEISQQPKPTTSLMHISPTETLENLRRDCQSITLSSRKT